MCNNRNNLRSRLSAILYTMCYKRRTSSTTRSPPFSAGPPFFILLGPFYPPSLLPRFAFFLARFDHVFNTLLACAVRARDLTCERDEREGKKNRERPMYMWQKKKGTRRVKPRPKSHLPRFPTRYSRGGLSPRHFNSLLDGRSFYFARSFAEGFFSFGSGGLGLRDTHVQAISNQSFFFFSNQFYRFFDPELNRNGYCQRDHYPYDTHLWCHRSEKTSYTTFRPSSELQICLFKFSVLRKEYLS